MPLKIAVPDLVSNSYFPAVAAVELGFFKKERLDVACPVDAVSSYFHAKDGNRPFLRRRAFAEDVHLEMVVKTDAISFPSSANRLAAVEEVRVRRIVNDFENVYFENVYSFGLARPTDADRRRFSCSWRVAMSAKNNGPIRVGSGRYNWQFSSDASCLVEKTDRHHRRDAGPSGKRARQPDEVVRNMPRIEGLAPVERDLKKELN